MVHFGNVYYYKYLETKLFKKTQGNEIIYAYLVYLNCYTYKRYIVFQIKKIHDLQQSRIPKQNRSLTYTIKSPYT